MGACNTENVEINILVYENEMFSLPAEFHFNNRLKLELPMVQSYLSNRKQRAKINAELGHKKDFRLRYLKDQIWNLFYLIFWDVVYFS